VVYLVRCRESYGPLSLMYLAPGIISMISSYEIPGLLHPKKMPGIRGGVVALISVVIMGVSLVCIRIYLETGLAGANGVLSAWVSTIAMKNSYQ